MSVRVRNAVSNKYIFLCVLDGRNSGNKDGGRTRERRTTVWREVCGAVLGCVAGGIATIRQGHVGKSAGRECKMFDGGDDDRRGEFAAERGVRLCQRDNICSVTSS